MTKKVNFGVLFSLLAILLACPVHAQVQKKLLAAPDIIPPATAEMQRPEFWISRIKGDPDKVIMNRDQIREFNKKNYSRNPETKDINGVLHTFEDVIAQGSFGGIHFHIEDPLAVKSITGDSLKVWFSRTKEYLKSGTFYDRRWLPYPEASKQALLDAMNEEAIPAVVKPRYGILIRNTFNRVVPTYEKIYTSQYGWLDMFQNADYDEGMTVAILHVSKNRDWYYVKTEYAFGWISADNVAEGTVQEIKRLADPENFIVALEHKVPVYADGGFKTWIMDLYQGSRLLLVKKTAAGYEVRVPYRQADGSLVAVAGWVKSGADVNVGYQAYTQRNVINTAFRLLNRPYGWVGTDHERDCVGSLKSTLRTFGIFVPRWTTFMLYYTDHVTSFPADTPKEVKYKYLDRCTPGITICGFDWHVVLYLGEVGGVHYIIHENGYSYHDADGNEIRVGRMSVNNTELEGGADITRWTELSEFKP
ncbi:MAG: SH3 domain-containing protein [Candidatus Latescibacterota bacterium]